MPPANAPVSASAAVILVVDDEPQNLRLIARLLTLDGYEMVTAGDSASGQTGKGAIRWLWF